MRGRGRGDLAVTPAATLCDIFLVRQAALRGAGIAFVPDSPIPFELLFGDEELVRALDGKVGRPHAMWLLASAKTMELPALRIGPEQLMRMALR